jgi:hypothetical protein
MQTQTAIRTDAISRRFAEYEPSECLETEVSSSEILPRLRIAGGVLRALFIVSLLIVTMHVCMPQREHVWGVRVASRPHPDDFGLRSVCLARDTTLHYAKGRPSLPDLVLFILSFQASRSLAIEISSAVPS